MTILKSKLLRLSYISVETISLEVNIIKSKNEALLSAGQGRTSWLSFEMFNCVSFTFPCGILGQVWYLVVSIPEFCHLSYLVFHVCHVVLSVPSSLVVTCWERADLLAPLCARVSCVFFHMIYDVLSHV